jgi:hypothetical protein
LKEYNMKQIQKRALYVLPIIGVVTLMTACGSPQVSQNVQTELDYRQQAKVATQAINEAPIWMSKLPKETGVIYENGTAISSDFSMADLKAKTMAYVKICTGAGGKVRSQMKMYRADNDAASVEQSELTVRSLCPDVDITGVETVEMKHVAEGNRIRTYVLVALPMGSKNIMKSTKDVQNKSGDAFKELDNITKEQNTPQAAPQVTPAKAEPAARSPEARASEVRAPIASPPATQAATPATTPAPVATAPIQQSDPVKVERVEPPLSPATARPNVAPATKMDGSLLESVKAVGNDSVIVKGVDGADKQVNLIGSKNPDYLAKRAEALNKPGAVIGQVSVE